MQYFETIDNNLNVAPRDQNAVTYTLLPIGIDVTVCVVVDVDERL
jgi:hypothetical protein